MPPWILFTYSLDLDPARLAEDCARWGLEHVLLAPDQLTDPRLAEALRARGIGLVLNLPVLYAPLELRAHPEHLSRTWRDRPAVHSWLHMACPGDERFLAARARRFEPLLRDLAPAAVSLDFLRFYVHWEEVPLDGDPAAVEDGCYCRDCLAAFAREAGEVAHRGPDGALPPEQWPAWAAWKSRRITELCRRFAGQVRAALPDTPLYVKTIPWGQGDLADGLRRVAGQDLEALAPLVDAFAPMTFTHVLGLGLEWKARCLQEVARRTGKPVLSYIQTASLDGRTLPLADLEAELADARRRGHPAVVFGWEALTGDPARQALVAARHHPG